MKSLANSSNSNPPTPPAPSSSDPPQKVKMVLLGDSQVGKTSLVSSYTTLRAFPQQQTSPSKGGGGENRSSNNSTSSSKSGSMSKNCNSSNLTNSCGQLSLKGSAKLKAPFADYYATVTVDDKDFELSMWDTNSSAEYEHIRPLNFAKTDIFLLCFLVTQQTSLDNVAAKWVPEIKSTFPSTSSSAGGKGTGGGGKEPLRLLVGLQTDLREEQWMAYDKGKRISKETAMQVAREIGAVDYVECCARTGEGVEDVFLTALNAAIYPQLHDTQKHASGGGGEKINLRGSAGANLSGEEDYYNKDALDLGDGSGMNNSHGGGGHKKRRCVIC